MPDMNVNEVVTENEDGSFTIFVNAFRHIKNLDFEKSNTQEIELSAHNYKAQ